MGDIDVAALRARTLVLPDEHWVHEGDCGGSLCEECGHCLHSLDPACDHECGGGSGGCRDSVMTDEIRYRLDVLALLDQVHALQAAHGVEVGATNALVREVNRLRAALLRVGALLDGAPMVTQANLRRALVDPNPDAEERP